MDKFSWFRRRRQTPPGHSATPSSETDIPLIAAPSVGFVVYFSPGAGASLPTEDEVRDIALDWLEEQGHDPLRPLLREFLKQGLLTPNFQQRQDSPEPPDEILRAYNPGEIEERRFRAATHTVFVGTPDLLMPPRVGLWASLTMARALAATLPGAVIVDPEFPRLLPLSAAREHLPMDGRVRVVDHILVPYSHDTQTGLLWITTKGMGRFGLPDLELRDVPPNLASPLLPIVNGMAQWMVDRAMHHVLETLEQGGSLSDEPAILSVRAEKTLRLREIRRAYAPEFFLEDEDDSETEDVPGEAKLRMEMGQPRKGEPPLLRLLPPAGVSTGTGIWLNTLLDDLFGADMPLAEILSENAEMETAHREAVDELPRVRARFQAGFRSGEVLHIKHGFSTPEESHEYMWIAVTRWEDGRIRGNLANDPQRRNDLRAGEIVEIAEEEVFDWLIVHSDGRVEGAFTNRLLQE